MRVIVLHLCQRPDDYDMAERNLGQGSPSGGLAYAFEREDFAARCMAARLAGRPQSSWRVVNEASEFVRQAANLLHEYQSSGDRKAAATALLLARWKVLTPVPFPKVEDVEALLASLQARFAEYRGASPASTEWGFQVVSWSKLSGLPGHSAVDDVFASGDFGEFEPA